MTRPIPLPGDAISAENLCRDFRRLIALTGLILMAETRWLWFGSPENFPQVPLVSWCLGCPSWVGGVFACLMVVALGWMFIFRIGGKPSYWPHLVFAVALIAAVLLNQHRLQPWAWELCILLVVMALLPPLRAVPCLRLIVASIYLHSGLSKVDVTFLATHGEVFVSVLTNTFGWDLASAPVAVRRTLVATLPVGEIAVAIGLCGPKTRRVAKWFSVVMHVLLLWILGPWGLDHQPGVLIWNVFFILQNLILFRPVSDLDDGTTDANETALDSRANGVRIKIGLGYSFVVAVVLLPFLEPWGWYDHWPAWAVYASRPEQTRVYIAENRIADLPAELREFVDEEPTQSENMQRWLAGKAAWHRLRTDRWSLEALKVPVYPQDRFQLGVALSLAEQFRLEDDIRVEIDSPADRWTGERSRRILEGTKSIRDAIGEFCMNGLPR